MSQQDNSNKFLDGIFTSYLKAVSIQKFSKKFTARNMDNILFLLELVILVLK